MKNLMTNSSSFKKRRITGYILPKLIFGTIGLKFDKNYTFEKPHLFILKRKLKFFLKKKSLYKKSWCFLSPNYRIFFKGKNSRMGKGKGTYKRTVYRIKKNKIFLEFFNLNYIFLKKISLFFKKYSNLENSIFKLTKPKLNLFQTDLKLYNIYIKN